jgi:WXG100 family type VII secretion target
MDNSQIAIDFGRLTGTQEHIAQTVLSMNKTLASLKEYIRPLTASWTGEASSQYQALQAQWDTSAEDLNIVLGRISTTLSDVIEQMRAAERKIAQTF